MRLMRTFIAMSVVTACAVTPGWSGPCDWSPLSGETGGTGVNDTVFALAVYDDGNGPALYAGGSFRTAGGRTVNNIAKWDGDAWFALSGPAGTGTNARVQALTVFDDGTGPALYAGGAFTTAGGRTVNRIAKWDGKTWSPLSGPDGVGMDLPVQALTVYDDGSGPALYAGGRFNTAGGQSVNYMARWDGAAWSPVTIPGGTGVYAGSVWSLLVFNNGTSESLYAGRYFIDTTTPVGISSIGEWDGLDWMPLTSPGGMGMSGTVYAMTTFDDGSGPALYAGGFSTSAGGQTINYIVKWDGADFSPLVTPGGTGVDNSVKALAVFDDGAGETLFLGGKFITAGGQTVNCIAKWDGTDFSPLAGATDPGVDREIISPIVYALAVFNDGDGDALYVGGRFTTAGGQTISNIAKWRPSPPCLADLNNDCVVDADDFFLFLQLFADGDPRADINNDGIIDTDDFLEYLNLFAQGC